jgi:hypothetical protein
LTKKEIEKIIDGLDYLELKSEQIIDEAIGQLTKQMLEDYEKNGKVPIKMTNFELYQHSIKLLKLIKEEIIKSEGFGIDREER